eukprot:scaffold3789_cov44-Attheya_sp.AAC.9
MSNNVSLFISIPGYCGPGYQSREVPIKIPHNQSCEGVLRGSVVGWEVAGGTVRTVDFAYVELSCARVTPVALPPGTYHPIPQTMYLVPLLKWNVAAKRLKEWKFWHGAIPFGSGLPQTL